MDVQPEKEFLGGPPMVAAKEALRSYSAPVYIHCVVIAAGLMFSTRRRSGVPAIPLRARRAMWPRQAPTGHQLAPELPEEYPA